MFQLRIIKGESKGKIIPVSKTLILGRSMRSDSRIIDPNISRRHAQVIVDGEKVSVQDMGSANGTRLNHHRITEETLLLPGDVPARVARLSATCPGRADSGSPTSLAALLSRDA